MEAQLFIAFLVFIVGNCYWGYRYIQAARKQPEISGQQMEQIQDAWIQFICGAIVILIVVVPLANLLQLL
ncbi:MAG: hypothetical protein R3Y10_03680 [Ferrimonas sp.]